MRCEGEGGISGSMLPASGTVCACKRRRALQGAIAPHCHPTASDRQRSSAPARRRTKAQIVAAQGIYYLSGVMKLHLLYKEAREIVKAGDKAMQEIFHIA